MDVIESREHCVGMQLQGPLFLGAGGAHRMF